MSNNKTAQRARTALYRGRGCHDRGLTAKEMAMFIFIEKWFVVHANNRKRKSAKEERHAGTA